MKTKLDMLLSLKGAGKYNEIRDTWAALGSLLVTNKTKLYTKDTLFQVQIPAYTSTAIAQPELTNALVFCNASYAVNDTYPMINWDNVSVSEIEGKCCIVSGVTSPHFRVILTGTEFASITTALNEDYVPFSGTGMDSETEIIIDDSELERILVECGVPFLRPEELEYTRAVLCNDFIKPTLQEYFKWWPIKKEVCLGTFGANQEFMIELPKDCYAVSKLFYTRGNSIANSFGSGALGFMRSEGQMAGGGYSSGFGGGISYRKNTAGFVGLENRNAALLERAANQAYTNYGTREKFSYIRENGKVFITGYSTVGGNLEAHYACYSPNWNDVAFDRLNEARDYATAKILQGLGMLRGLVKTDIAGAIDYSLYTNRAEKLKTDVMDFWKKSPTSIAVISRGGA